MPVEEWNRRSLDAVAVREACVRACENVYGGRAHTYASENADIYRAQDGTIASCVKAILALGQINAATQIDGSSPSGSGAGSTPAKTRDTERRFDSSGPAVAAPDPQEGEVAGAAPDVWELVYRPDVLLGETLAEYVLRHFTECCGAWSDVKNKDGTLDEAKCQYASAIEKRVRGGIKELDALLAQPAAAGVSEERMPNPTDADLADPLFDAIWQVTKRWDVNAPEYYVGYCGMNGSHVMLILNAIRHSLAERADRGGRRDE